MDKMFDRMMKGFCGGLSEEDGRKIKGCFEKMSAMCPCSDMKALTEDDRKALMEKMKSFCGGMMGMMSQAGRDAGPTK
jgi:hypothetical protein